MKPITSLITALALIAATPLALACKTPVSVCESGSASSFPLIRRGQPAALLIEPAADSAVRRAAASFAADLERVGGRAPQQLSDASAARGELVIAGVIGQSPAIDALIRAKKIDVTDLPGQWEAFRQIVVEQPLPNVNRALVIAGADRRGVVFGLYDLSEKIGVSPWYWFADVPVNRKPNVFLTAGTRRDQPKVRYRGFFINDEAPAFSTWAQLHFGGANHQMYQHVFELLLRLKGNYLWPAMWAPRAFNDDDRENMVLADAMGVVMGTSHHEPMTRAQDEWHRNEKQGVTGGKWDFSVNADNLRKFWRGGIERMMSKGGGQAYESLVTVGMRGDGDEPMSEGTATDLLERVVAAQRDIIRDVTGKPAEQQPQVWALYKEVQDYYDHGMKVPDDVTLLFADDNWGQIRRLPTGDVSRRGGYGVYYHFDYVGGPRNYKWLNTNQIEKTWQQMDLAYQRGARALWIVNVGDIKPMEFPLSFFMAQAWNPEAMTLDVMTAYPEQWARSTFGPTQSKQIASLLTRYGQLASLRKPELLDANSFPLDERDGVTPDGRNFDALLKRWTTLEEDLAKVKAGVASEQRDAFFQLVEHPVSALANLYRLYEAVAWNHKRASNNDRLANAFADRAKALYERDQALSSQYHALVGGKWDGMMLQTHIGYTNWQQPDQQSMPVVKYVDARSRPYDVPVSSTLCSDCPAPLSPISIEASQFLKGHSGAGLAWHKVPNLGAGAGAVIALPQGKAPTGQKDGVFLEYKADLPRTGYSRLQLFLLPTLETTGGVDVRIGVSIDAGKMQTLSLRLMPSPNAPTMQEQRDWEKAVSDNQFVLEARFPNLRPGEHVIKVWRIDDNALLTRLAIQ
jgi:hypothetical protein